MGEYSGGRWESSAAARMQQRSIAQRILPESMARNTSNKYMHDIMDLLERLQCLTFRQGASIVRINRPCKHLAAILQQTCTVATPFFCLLHGWAYMLLY